MSRFHCNGELSQPDWLDHLVSLNGQLGAHKQRSHSFVDGTLMGQDELDML